MDKLTEEQQRELREHMNKFEDAPWAAHIAWAWGQWNIEITAADCLAVMMG